MTALSATARHEYYAELGNSLPPPVLRTQENHERRLKTAIETFDALRPGDAYEGRLAVTIVVCGAHAVDSLREAGVHHDDFAKMARCRAQAASMARVEGAAKRTLEREQKLRLAVEAVAGAVPAQPVAEAASPSPNPVPPSAPVAQAATQTRAVAAPATPPPEQAASAPPPSPKAIAQAEVFAHLNIVAAARIRQDGGITAKCKASFRHLTLPTDPAVIDALVRGMSDVLTVLDDVGGEMLAAAD